MNSLGHNFGVDAFLALLQRDDQPVAGAKRIAVGMATGEFLSPGLASIRGEWHDRSDRRRVEWQGKFELESHAPILRRGVDHTLSHPVKIPFFCPMSAKILAGSLPDDAILRDCGESLFIQYRNREARWFSFDESRIMISVASQAKTAELLTQENQSRVLPKIGFGLAGAALLGPVGLLAGVLGSGQRTEVCFAAELADGRKFVGTCGLRAWQGIQAAILKRGFEQTAAIETEAPVDRPESTQPAAVPKGQLITFFFAGLLLLAAVIFMARSFS